MLSITKQMQQDELVIVASGTIDITTIWQLIEEIEMEMVANKYISLDLSQVDLIDSTGIGYIMRAMLTYRSDHKHLRLIHIPEIIEETFELMGVNQILNMKLNVRSTRHDEIK